MSDFENEASQPLLSGHPSSTISEDSTLITTELKSSDFRAFARIAGCCISCASAGWHDGCIGALIPYLQIYYGSLTDEKISLIFIGAFTGYILASLLNVTLNTHLGLPRLITLGATIQALASLLISLRPPFALIVTSYSLAGFGIALQDAQFNTYVARLPGAETKLGILHALYGVGALLSPAAATLLMKAGVAPPMFYLSNVAWCCVAISVLLLGFGFSGTASFSPDGKPRLVDGEGVEDEHEHAVTPLKTVISSRVVWPALIFISLYTGAETGEAGWIVSFLMRTRSGGFMSGYASSAFYTGLTSSRILLLPLTAYLTEHLAITLYCSTALLLQVLIWSSSSLLVDFIAVAACGFVMGPVYPITVSLVTKATPHGHHPGALSLMACAGQLGSALFPFLVGALADVRGIRVLQPMMVGLFVVMIVVWQFVPSPGKRTYRWRRGERLREVCGSEDSERID